MRGVTVLPLKENSVDLTELPEPPEIDVHVLDQVTDGLNPDLVSALGATYHDGSVADSGVTPDVTMECTSGSPRSSPTGCRSTTGRRRTPASPPT
jgi:hypothetical protein